MRLLLDEMYPVAIAAQLRQRAHDVSAVTERAELRALSDEMIFALAQRERRAVVTENVVDFIPLVDAADQRGEAHHGLVLISPVKFVRGNKRTLGRLVTALDALLREHPEEEPTSPRLWL